MAYNYGNDIGYLGNTPGIQPVYNNIKRNQVYQATHNSNDERTSYNARSYISFSFGGTQIEDLNLIACVDGDRMEKQLTANFHDLTSSYDVVDGQFYWGTYYDNNQMNFYLATDGMTQENLEDFIRLFAPGSTRELILAEHPNRAIMARVATPPVMNVIPFQEDVDLKVNTMDRSTITALYKGDIHLELIMDEPFWYGRVNVLGEKVHNNELNIDEWVANWVDANDNHTIAYNDKDALRIIYEDRIPTMVMLRAPCFLGNDLVYIYNTQCARVDYALVGAHDAPLGAGEEGAIIIRQEELQNPEVGKAQAAIEEMNDSMKLDRGESTYLYYSGTAPEKPIIKFIVNGAIDDLLKQEIKLDFYCGEEIQHLELKTPLIYQDYKKVKDAFSQWDSENDTYRDIRLFVRSNIIHPVIKKWSLFIIDYCQAHSTEVSLTTQGVVYLKFLFLRRIIHPNGIEQTSYVTNEYELNFQTGELVCYFQYRNLDMLSILDYPSHILYLDNPSDFTNDIGVTYHNVSFPMAAYLENINNSLYSKPIILRERNHFSSDGTIRFYKQEDKLLSYKIVNNSNIDFDNISIEFVNRYY